MKQPQWIPLESVLAIHRYQLSRFGGSAGIRDQGLLESALARPMHLNHYQPEASIFELAAAYGYGIAKNYPCIDGNKRAALVMMGVFLERNGYRFIAPQVETLLKVLALAAGELSEEALAEWLKTATIKAAP
jgi:death on curing protein